MNATALPMTAALSPLAAQVGHDLTPLAKAEMAFNAMLQAALNRDDEAWEAAKAQFENCRSDAR